MSRQGIIKTALGEKSPDVVLKNAYIVNVFTGETEKSDIAIADGLIAGVGDYDGENAVDLSGKYVIPGLINAHCHIESSMVTPPVYCAEELKHGVTSIIADPHEIVNVAGEEGMRFILRETETLLADVFLQVPSCVPATPLECNGGVFTPRQMAGFLGDHRVLGLGEMMNYTGVFDCDFGVLEKLLLFEGKIADGHAPGVTGMKLQALAAAGIATDHESVSFPEALEKLRAGISVLVREGSAAKNLDAIMTGVVESKIDTSNMAFCSDDKHLGDIIAEGSIRAMLRRAVELGLKPETAVQMATINAAKIYRLNYGNKRRGAVAPGYIADLVITEDLKSFNIINIYKNGRLVSLSDKPSEIRNIGRIFNSVNPAPIPPGAFTLPEKEKYPVIRLLPGQITTRLEWLDKTQVAEGLADKSLNLVAVIERHNATGNVGLGLLSGWGLKEGAVGSTVAHDSHNIIIAGTNEPDMLLAAKELVNMRGGYVITSGEKVLASLPLPVAGLMSTLPAHEFCIELEALAKTAKSLGVTGGSDPFISLSFIALPVIPEVRITDRGILTVDS